MELKQFIQNKYKLGDKLNSYLSVKGDNLYYKNINLMSLANKYSTPLEVAYTDMINEKVMSLKKIYRDAIKKYNYPGKFHYAYATKANYYSEVVSTAMNHIDYIETSSSYDLDIIKNLFDRGIFSKKIPIICNGFKYGRYFKRIKEFKKQEFNIIPILENAEEVEAFLKIKNLKFDVGFRLSIDEDVARSFEGDKRLSSEVDTRFGLDFPEIKKYADLIAESKNLQFKVLHFHIGGTIINIDKYIKFVSNVFESRYCQLKKKHPELSFFDIGGGLPAQYSLDFDFDYERLANLLIKNIKRIARKHDITPPDIIGENGRYTVNDHGFSLFKIALTKPTKRKNTFWYLINSSLMNFLPDSWALGQEFIILPLNGWEKDYAKAKLGGVTCDPDDTYYKSDKDNLLYMPKIEPGEDLYVGIFGVGAYQEIISGVGGVHHCLLPEGNELIIYKKKGKLVFDQITKLQTARKILNMLDYHGHHSLKRYKK